MMLRSHGAQSKQRQKPNEESNSRKLPSRAGVHIFVLVALVLCSLTVSVSMLRSFNNVATAYKRGDDESSNIEGASATSSSSISSVANYESHTNMKEKEQLDQQQIQQQYDQFQQQYNQQQLFEPEQERLEAFVSSWQQQQHKYHHQKKHAVGIESPLTLRSKHQQQFPTYGISLGREERPEGIFPLRPAPIVVYGSPGTASTLLFNMVAVSKFLYLMMNKPQAIPYIMHNDITSMKQFDHFFYQPNLGPKITKTELELDGFARYGVIVFATATDKENAAAIKASLGAKGLDVGYVLDLETLQEEGISRIAHDFAVGYGLKHDYEEKLVDYFTKWQVLKRCCAQQLWQYSRMHSTSLINMDESVGQQDHFCADFDMDKTESAFIQTKIYSWLEAHHNMLAFNTPQQEGKELNGTRCSAVSTMLASVSSPKHEEKRTQAVDATPITNCRRSCTHLNNRIIILDQRKAGLLDRAYIMRAWANVGRFLCARVLVPRPFTLLTTKHSDGIKLSYNASFEKEFFYFVDADDPDQIILSDQIDVDEPSGGWGLNLESVTSHGDTDQVIEHFSQAISFTRQQQEQTTEGEKPFLWTVRGQYHGYNMHFLKHLYDMKDVGDESIIPSHQIPKWERYQDDSCVYATKMEAASILQTKIRVLQKLKNRFDVGENERLQFGYLHVRRGDSKREEEESTEGYKCYTELPKMARYLQCTFKDFGRQVKNGRPVPLLFGTDETDAMYRRGLFSLINDIPYLEAIDLDKEVLDEIEHEIASGMASPDKRNNYSVYLISLAIIEDASFYLRQRRIWCNECDADLVSLDEDESRKRPWLTVDWPTGLRTSYQKQANPFHPNKNPPPLYWYSVNEPGQVP